MVSGGRPDVGSTDRRWLVDEVVDEPGVAYREWDAEGASVAEALT